MTQTSYRPTFNEEKFIIKRINVGKSPGPCGIPVELLFLRGPWFQLLYRGKEKMHSEIELITY